MPTRSAALGLYRGLKAYFADTGVTAAVRFGWRARFRQDNQGPGGGNRVVLVPGKSDGTIGEPRPLSAGVIDHEGPLNFYADAEIVMRPIAYWHYPLSCFVWAADPAHPEDEECQEEATTGLLELTFQGLKNAVDPVTGMAVGFANIEEIGEPLWVMPPVESAYGREILLPLTLLTTLSDPPIGQAYPQPAVARNPVA